VSIVGSFDYRETAPAITREPFPLFDPLRQFFVAGRNLAHRLFSVSVIRGFGSGQDLLSTCSQVSCERSKVDIYHFKTFTA
jgi:hypothetical protein